MARSGDARLAALTAVLICALLCVTTVTAGAQQHGIVHGTVRDSAGQPITGAEVGIIGTPTRARTADDGMFRFVNAPLGVITIQARRIGFRMNTLNVPVVSDEVSRVDMQLQALGMTLAPVVVRSRGGRYTGRLAGFYERMQSGLGGRFLTRDRIAEGNPRQLTQVLQQVPGVEIVRGGRIRLRGRNCPPLVWIDGVAMAGGEVDLNSFPPSSIEGIELYMTASGAPLRYQATVDRARCGTILLWSRGPDTDMRRRVVVTSPDVLDLRVAGGELYTALDVDVPAQLDSATLRVMYPPELMAEGIGGSVLAEVVVDAAGRTEPATFGVVHSSHPLFARAVQEAVRVTEFRPAVRQGRQVAQLVQIPVRFDPPGGQSRRKRG
jgi:TonB family protein